MAELEYALEMVETESARARVELELDHARRKAAGEEMDDDDVDNAAAAAASHSTVPVVAEATTVLLLSVVREGDGGPRRTWTSASWRWTRWAVVRGWGPVEELAGEASIRSRRRRRHSPSCARSRLRSPSRARSRRSRRLRSPSHARRRRRSPRRCVL